MRIALIKERLGRGAGFERIEKFKRWARKADEHATVVVGSVENTELEAQRKIAEGLLGVIKKPQRAAPITDHLAIQMKHSAAIGTGKVPVFKSFIRAVK